MTIGLIRLELRKIFSARLVIPAAVVLLLLNVGSIVKNNEVYFGTVNAPTERAADAMTKDYEGRITQEKISRLQEYIDRLTDYVNNSSAPTDVEYYSGSANGDLFLAGQLMTDIRAAYDYDTKIDALLADNDDLYASARSSGSDYLIRVASRTARTYSERYLTDYYDTSGAASALDYGFSSFLVLLLAALMCAPVFAGEKEKGMDLLFASAYAGRRKLAFAKLCACALACAAVGAVFFASDLITYVIVLRIRGLSEPLYSLEAFAYTPLNISVGGFFLLSYALRITGTLCLCSVFGFLSSVLHRSRDVFAASLLVVFAAMACAAFGGEDLAYLKLIDPVMLLVPNALLDSQRLVNIFNYPVSRFTLTLICCLLVSLLMSAACLSLNDLNMHRGRTAK